MSSFSVVCHLLLLKEQLLNLYYAVFCTQAGVEDRYCSFYRGDGLVHIQPFRKFRYELKITDRSIVLECEI